MKGANLEILGFGNGQIKADGHSWQYKSANCRTGLCMLYHIHNHGHRRAKPVILASPVLGQRVNCITTRWQKSQIVRYNRTRNDQLCGVPNPYLTERILLNSATNRLCLQKRLIISAFWLASRGIHWVSICISLVKHNWNKSIATDCGGCFGLPNNTILDAFSLSVKTLTFLWQKNWILAFTSK